MYDLANDPDEIRNLWDDPQYADRRARLTKQLLRRMMNLQENAPCRPACRSPFA